MGKEHRDGLYMDNSIVITDMKNAGFPIQTRLFQVFAILFGAWSSISILLESIPLPAKTPYIHLTIGLTSVIVLILCLIPSYDMVKLFFCFLFYTLFAISRFPIIQNGFYIMENVVIDRIENYYDVSIGDFVANYKTEVVDTTLLMIMITIPVVSLLAIAIVRGRFINITSVVLVLPIAVSFLIGLTPSEKYLVSYIVAALYLTRLSIPGNNPEGKKQKSTLHRINSWAGVWISMISLLLFFLLKLFISQESYNEITKIDEVKNDIQAKLFSISIEDIAESVTNFRLPEFNTSKGGLDGGSLSRTGKVEFTGSEQLRIKANFGAIKDGIYLKGYVGSEYTGDRWVGHTGDEADYYRELKDEYNNDEFIPVNQTADLLSLAESDGLYLKNNQQQMEIEYIGANKRFLYSPYFTNYSELNNLNYKQDLYATPSKNNSSYTFDFYNFMNSSQVEESMSVMGDIYFSLNKREAYVENEKVYGQFVQKAYTKVPENGLERLKKQCLDAMAKESLFTTEEKIAYIKRYLSLNTSYSLTPGKTPTDKDYVEYFLYDNKLGYCSHYASAAVLMLRIFGVPARYVEGYTVSPSDIAINGIGEMPFLLNYKRWDTAEISVKDYNAHAWVEIYQNGVGWIPLEFTPPSGIGYNAYNREELIAPSPTATVAPTKELTPTPILEKTQDEIQKPDITKPAQKDELGTADIEVVGGNKEYKTTFKVIIVVLMVLCIPPVVLVRRKLKLKKTSNNKKAIYFFARVERILNFMTGSIHRKRIMLEDDEAYLKYSYDFIDFDELESFMYTVRKARYGRGRISKVELQQVQRFHDNILLEIYSELPFIRRAFLKLILWVN